MSTSVHLFNDGELKHLLRKSQTNNLVNNVTGMLLYSEGGFIQVLEGNIDDVDETYDKIKKDSRHKNIIQVAEGDLEERLFPNWSMGFKTLSAEEFSRFDAYVADPKNHPIWTKADLHPATSMIRVFAETNKF